MDRGFSKIRCHQQTIPNMMRARDERTQGSRPPLRNMRATVDNSLFLRDAHRIPNLTRMNPYKVPFQYRQPIEPLYADTAPVAMQIASPMGMGMYGEASGIFMSKHPQNVIEPPVLAHQNEILDDEDNYMIGLITSPPNHCTLQKNSPGPLKPEKVKEIEKAIHDNVTSQGKITPKKKQTTYEPVNSSLRVLTGSVEKIIKWEKMWENKKDKPPLLFEIIAPLLQLKEGMRPYEHHLLIRETGGPVLTVVYYEIDQSVPKLNRGQYVRCVCTSLGKRRFQAYTVRPASQQECSSLQRLSFLCQKALQDAILSSYEQ